MRFGLGLLGKSEEEKRREREWAALKTAVRKVLEANKGKEMGSRDVRNALRDRGVQAPDGSIMAALTVLGGDDPHIREAVYTTYTYLD